MAKDGSSGAGGVVFAIGFGPESDEWTPTGDKKHLHGSWNLLYTSVTYTR